MNRKALKLLEITKIRIKSHQDSSLYHELKDRTDRYPLLELSHLILNLKIVQTSLDK